MDALFYLWKHSLKNRVKKALKKPVTYVYIVFLVLYMAMMGFGLTVMFENPTPVNMALILSAMAMMIIPGNIITYAKRKGLAYRNSDVHFLFPSPIEPKKVLLFALLKTNLLKIFTSIIIMAAGVLLFKASLIRMLLYAVFSLFIHGSYECASALLLFGSEKLTERSRKLLVIAAYAIWASLAVIAVYVFMQVGISFAFAARYFECGALKLVPVFGWYVSVVYLILEGPELFTLIGSGCYLVSWILFLVLAIRMKCTGEYYEDALKFAEDYEEAIASRKNGQTVTAIGKKQKFNKASIQWKGRGARALFYRQLLEYKKSRFFLFDFFTVIHLLAGIAVAFVYYTGEKKFGLMAPYVAPGVGAYIIFISTSISGKWSKELISPYTYLIPDSAFNKLMNVTLITNIQNLINGCLICLPAAIIMRLSLLQTVLGIVLYVTFAAAKIYCYTATEIMVSNVLGTFGRQLLMMVLQGFAVSAIFAGGLLGYLAGGIHLSMLLAAVFGLAYTSIFAVISTLNFYRLEKA